MSADEELRREVGELIAKRIEAEVVPLIEKHARDGGYDCCGCGTYYDIAEHAVRIAREVGRNG